MYAILQNIDAVMICHGADEKAHPRLALNRLPAIPRAGHVIDRVRDPDGWPASR